ncbi:hypothetical protein [Bradyrhizobium sp. USDA 4350]
MKTVDVAGYLAILAIFFACVRIVWKATAAEANRKKARSWKA